MKSLKPNPLQQAAIDYLDGPLLVLAGPGTGKTQLLSGKVAHILEITDTAPENILCLTFTENGATNMRERLASLIGPAAHHINIHTYHAFGQSIIAQYKNYNPAYQRRLDNPVDEVSQFKIIHEIQSALAPADILRGDNPRDILDTISSAKSAQLTPDDLAKIAAQNQEDGEAISAAATPILANLKPRMKFADALTQVYQPLLEVLIKFTATEPIVANIERLANPLSRELKSLIDTELAKEGTTTPAGKPAKPSISPLTKWKTRRFERDDAGNYRLTDRVAILKTASLSEIMKLYNKTLESQGLYDFDDMISEAIHFLKTDRGFRLTLSERYQYILLDEFQDTNPVQFEIIKLLTDYEQPSVMAVGDDDQAIFEFQGANASNLLDFQSHYNAKIITLTDNYRSTSEILSFSRHIAEQIDDSFAGKHQIDKSLTAVRDQELHSSQAAISAHSNNLIASAPQQTTTPESPSAISRHEFLSADAEYYWVAEQIRQLLDAGEDPADIAVITPKHKYIAPLLPYLKAQHIDIAYEKKTDVLSDPKIHQLLTIAEFIYQISQCKPAAHRALEILSFPFWQLDPLAVIAAINHAKSHPDGLLTALAASDNSDLAAIAHFFAFLVQISHDAPLEKFFDYLIGVLPADLPTGEYRSPFLQFYQDDGYSSFALYENLTSLKNAIARHTTSDTTFAFSSDAFLAFEGRVSLAERPRVSPENAKNASTQSNENVSKISLKNLIRFLQDYHLAGATLLNTSPYQDSAHSVQVMTAFKSKGLEFKHVYLIAVDDLSWGKAKGNNNTLSLPVNLLPIRHTNATDDERLRVFFVALTRAKSHLTLTNSIKDFAGKTPARLEYLAEYENSDHQIVSPYLPAQTDSSNNHDDHSETADDINAPRLVISHHDNLPAARQQTDLQTSWAAAYQELTPELRPLLLAKMKNYRLSASDLTAFIDLTYAGPLALYLRRVVSAPQEPPTSAITLGNLIHATFEQVTNNHLTDPEALDFFQKSLSELPLEAAESAQIAALGEHSLTAALQTFGNLLRAPHARAEVNLSLEHPCLEIASSTPDKSKSTDSHAASPQIVPLSGKIDHLQIDDQNKTIEVYDFKTGKYHKENWNSHATLYKYRLQLGFYKLLLNHSRTYANYTVTRGHILFVTPDNQNHGQVYDRIYEFNETDEQELIALAAAIYHHLTTLDFLDDPALALETNAQATLKQIKDFVKLLMLDRKPSSC